MPSQDNPSGGYWWGMKSYPASKAWQFMVMIPVWGFLSACTTVTYPNGTTVTTPYVAPAACAPIYGTPGYPVPVAPYAPPGTPGAYYGYGGGCAPLFGVGVGGWANFGGWGWGRGWAGGSDACVPYNGYRSVCVFNGYRPTCGFNGFRRGY